MVIGQRLKWLAGMLFLFQMSIGVVQASPWAAVGDMQLRNDVEILARHGVISGPVNTWPISWKQITRNLSRSSEMDLPAYVRLAAMRVKAKIPGELRTSVRLQATNNPAIVRGFAATARNDLDADAIAEYNSDSGTTVHIQGGYRKGNGEDYAHMDGSYLSQDMGNWSAYIGAFDRWWGPGRESTLILSNNARPMPSIGLRRIEPKAFETKWLSWMGPWQWDIFVAKMEKDRFVPEPIFVGMRLSFEPFENFEVGLSRTLQMCGEGRVCNFKSWMNGLIGFGDLDNFGDTQEQILNQPGNQLASLDFSYSFRIKERMNVKLYFEGTAEDLIMVLPYTYARMAGATFYGPYGNGGSNWRITAEASDTTGSLAWLYGHHRKGIIYNHFIYKTGYRYRGRTIGHSLDTDSRQLSLVVEFNDSTGWNYKAKYHHVEINIDGIGTNVLSTPNKNINVFEASLYGDVGFGNLNVNMRYSSDGIPELGHDGSFASFGFYWSFKY